MLQNRYFVKLFRNCVRSEFEILDTKNYWKESVLFDGVSPETSKNCNILMGRKPQPLTYAFCSTFVVGNTQNKIPINEYNAWQTRELN